MDACEVSAEDVDLDYVNAGGVREREARAGVSVVSPVRVGTARARFPAFRGPGQPVRLALVSDVWRACGYESWLDRDRLMLLDCDRW